MVLGITRARPRFDSRLAPAAPRLAVGRPRIYRSAVATDWVAERGAIRFEAGCDVIGGFPGFADRGGRLTSAKLRLTDNYLLIDEGRTHGFGLPVHWLDGSVLIARPSRDDPALRVFYRDGEHSRLFTIHFRGTMLALGGARRAERARAALHAAGLADRFATRPPAEPNFAVPWDQTRDFEGEHVIWTGRATAPLRIGQEAGPSAVWLTTRSLIWGSDSGDGINRLPLALLNDVMTAQLNDRLGTPAVYVAFGDESTGRYDLSFLFDQQASPDGEARERGAFLVAIRSRGVSLGTAAPLIQPWRINVQPTVALPVFPANSAQHAVADDSMDDALIGDAAEEEDAPEPTSFLALVDQSLRRPRRIGANGRRQRFQVAVAAHRSWVESDEDQSTDDPPHWESAWPTHEPIDEPLDFVLAEWSAPEPAPTESVPPGSRDDYQLAAAWVADTALTPSGESDLQLGSAAEPCQNGLDSGSASNQPTIPLVRDYEAAALAALTEILHAIADRTADRPKTPLLATPPTAIQQSLALAEVTEQTATGWMSPNEARACKARLIALGEAGPRLRTLLELRDAGHLSNDELAERRSSITGQLSRLILMGVR